MNTSKLDIAALKAAYLEWAELAGSMDERAYEARDRFDDLVRASFPQIVEELEREDRFRSSKYWARVVRMEAEEEARGLGRV